MKNRLRFRFIDHNLQKKLLPLDI